MANPPSDHDLPLSVQQRIDDICTAFEAAWKAGERPSTEAHLAGLREGERAMLLRELILLDVYYRRQGGEPLDTADYRQRFPELEEAWLRQALSPAPQTAPVGAAAGCGAGAAEAVPATIRYAGDYELREEIGRGGMGVVYRGHDADLHRTLAIKVLVAKHRDNAELKRRFLEEAQVMGQLQHPGVAPIHEVGHLEDGRPFFSMKQIQGQTLAERLRDRGSCSVDESSPTNPDPQLLAVFEQVCQTMAFAHSRGILHRDLKPHNVMVGEFGEVQVMDWGLAKVLTGVGEEQPAAGPAQNATTLLWARTDTPDGTATATGRVLGTPAYMAPEQARGEIEKVDERSDVFGLGAILCEILTGRPPFPGDIQAGSHRKAMKSDFGDTFVRLEGCRADSELVQLARRCLAAEREGRPRQAGEVAEALARYQTGVRERLRQAEIDRASAQVKAEEERKRALVERQKRRIAGFLFALAGVFLLAGAGVGVWYYQVRAALALEEGRKAEKKESLEQELPKQLAQVDELRKELHRRLQDAQDASSLLSDMKEWHALLNKLRETWARAKLLADSGEGLLDTSWFARLKTFNLQIEADEEDWDRARDLENVRLKAATLVQGKWDFRIAADEYPLLFRQMGLDVEKGDQVQVAEQIRQKPIRYALVAALDHWATTSLDKSLTERLLAISRQADPDPWRDQVRDLRAWAQRPKLLQLAEHAELTRQTPQIILLLAERLRTPKDKEQKNAAALVRKALVYYPQDFWLHFFLGQLVQDPVEKTGCYRAALAVRPESGPAHNNLGNALMNKGDLDGAIAHFQKILATDNFGMAHSNLGLALAAQKKWQEAIASYHKALALNPKDELAYYNLGNALKDTKEYQAALAAYQKAIDLAPDYAPAHNNRGAVLMAQKDYDGAITAFKEGIAACDKVRAAYPHAVDLKIEEARCYTNLGAALNGKKDYARAIAACQQAMALAPDYAPAHYSLGKILMAQKDYDGAIAAFEKSIAAHAKASAAYSQAIDLKTEEAQCYYHLGMVLKAKKDYDGAIAPFKKAIALNPKFVAPHSHLGSILLDKKDWAGAIEHFQKVVALEPNNALAYFHLGRAHHGKGNPDGAIAAYRQALAINPEDDACHNNLAWNLYLKKDWATAAEHYKKAIALNPKGAVAHNNFGVLLRDQDQQDLDGAIALLNKSSELDPKFVAPHRNLGLILLERKDVDGALQHFQKVVALEPKSVEGHLNLGKALRLQGKFTEALQAFHKGQQLSAKPAGGSSSAAKLIKECERLLELDQKLPAFLKGTTKPKDAAEQVEMAEFCLVYKKYHVAAAQSYAAALLADPTLAAKHQFHAACAAALAAAGKGKDADQLKEGDSARWRQQALVWLREELAQLKKQLPAAPKSAAATYKKLKHWQTDPDLAGVRAAQELAQLPEAEHKDWHELWAAVDALLQQIKAGASPSDDPRP